MRYRHIRPPTTHIVGVEGVLRAFLGIESTNGWRAALGVGCTRVFHRLDRAKTCSTPRCSWEAPSTCTPHIHSARFVKTPRAQRGRRVDGLDRKKRVRETCPEHLLGRRLGVQPGRPECGTCLRVLLAQMRHGDRSRKASTVPESEEGRAWRAQC